MNRTKITLLVVAIIAAIVSLGFMGLRAFTTKVMESRSCDWANIDNIELRTQIDIPVINDCDCGYDENSDIKRVVFNLKTGDINFAEYAKKNKLHNVNSQIAATDFTFGKNEQPKIDDSFYYREGKTKWENYKLALDSKTGKLWVYLKYLD